MDSSSDPPRVSASCLQGICRICHGKGTAECPLICPCHCSGSVSFVHDECLQEWIRSSGTRCCEICEFPFIMERRVKPFWQWDKLDSEMKPKIVCFTLYGGSVLTVTSITLFLLIQFIAEMMRSRLLTWVFWIMMTGVTISFLMNLVCLYVQCKHCLPVFRSWRDFLRLSNSILRVQNAPGKVGTLLQQQAAVLSDEGDARQTPRELTTFKVKRLSSTQEERNNSLGGRADVEAGRIRIVETCLTSPAILLLSMEDHNNPLREVVVVSGNYDYESSTDEQNAPSFCCKQTQRTPL